MVLATVISAILERYEVKQSFKKAPLVANTAHNHWTRGFTIIELIVIMAIIAILATFATLNLPGWRDNMNLRTTARDVVSYLQFAKVEAAKRNSSILVQIVAGGSGTGGCNVFIDNGQGGGTANDSTPNGGETLRELELPPKVSISGTTLSPFVFNNRGIPTSGGGTVTLTNGPRTYNVVLSAAGAVSLNGPL